MNTFNGDPFSNDQGTPVANSGLNNSHGNNVSTPNGVVDHTKSDHHSKHKKEHSSKDKHREHKHKDHKHSKEHKSKENHVSSSEHSSSKHHNKDDKTKEKSKDSSSSKDKHHDPSKSSSKHSSDKDKHRSSKEEKHKSEKHKSSHDGGSGDKPKDPLKLVIKPKDGSVHPSNDKHSSSKHSSSKHASSEKHKVKHSAEKHTSERSEKHSPEKHTSERSEKHSPEKHSLSANKHSPEKHRLDKVKSDSGHKEKHREKPIKEEPKVKAEPLSPVKIKTESAEMPSNNELSPPRQMVGMKSPSKLERSVKEEVEENDDDDEESDDEPLAARMEKVKKKQADTSQSKKRKTEDEDFKPVKKVKKEKTKTKPITKRPAPIDAKPSPTKRGKKKEEEEQEVWKWWEEEKKEDGVKWKTLQHQGPVFAPDYEPLPKNVTFYYDGKPMELTQDTEEVAGFYGRMLDHDYVTKEVFNRNFLKDWKKVMTDKERSIITDLSKCNFKEIDAYYKVKSEERKAMSKEQKQEIKKENEAMQAKYGFCVIDGHKQKIGNFKIEPPGLFRGRGEHPKMGMHKKRVVAKNIVINIGREATAPDPPPGQKWKEVRHDNAVTWLACWTENILGSNKYIMLNPSSKLKGEKDWQKYELARDLKKRAAGIQKQYQEDWKSKEMRIRQRAVALYFIDKLALRAGNEKEEGETADTVGCCSLRVEHITLDNEKDGKECVVTFDFLGKDSIRYINSVPVEKRVFRNLKLFMENKQPGDDLFDRLNTSILNKYLNDLMEGLTAKVFRTYNASKTLQEQLDLLTKEEMSLPEKMLAYNRANRAVAILCNHQRSVPKTFDKQMENLQVKINEKEEQIREQKKELKSSKDSRDKSLYEKKKKRLRQLEEQLEKLEVMATDKEENKQIALGTSKLNYLDPRISVAWCKKWEVPIEKIYNKTQRDKFLWAIEMATPDYKF